MYSYPLSDFTAQSLKNILFSLYSKGQLLSKAVNGQFFVPEELCYKIADTSMKEKIMDAMKTTPDLVGIEIRDDQLVFSGFLGNYYPSGIIAEEHVTSEASEYSEQGETQLPELQEYSEQSETQATDQAPAAEGTQETEAAEEEETPAISVFLDYFINHCKTVSYIQLVSPETDNERYTMRGWFNQLGWKGIEDRPLRMYFYERLSGHTAFRTEEHKRKWLENRRAEKEQRQNNPISNAEEQYAEQAEQADEDAECEQIETAQPEENIVPEQPDEDVAPECEQIETAQPEEHLAQECEPEQTEMPSERAESNSD